MKGPGWHILPGWHGLLLALFLVGLSAVSQAEGKPFPVDPVTGRQDFSRALTYLQDPDDQFSIDDMESVRERFSPLDARTTPPKGNAPLWLRLRLTNPGPQALTRWLSLGTPMLEHVEIYLLSPQQGSWDHQQGGTRVPRTKKPLRAPQPVFEIHLPPGESRLLLIHVSHPDGRPLNPTLWTPEAYRQASSEELLPQMLMLGGLMSGIFLALAAWAALRQRSWAWLALLTFSLCVLLSAHAGLLASYAWPASWAFPALVPLLAQAGSLYALAGLSLNALPAGMFPQRGRQALGILQGLTTLALLAGAWQPILAQQMLLWLAPVLGITCFLGGVRVLRRGFAPARYLVLGLGVWCLLELLRQGAVSGILPIPGLAGMSWALGPLLVLPLLLLSLMARNHHLADQLIISHQQNEAQRDFLARVNHELRSPLNTIIGFARMLKRGSARLTTREGAEGIEQNGLRLLTMIDELLEESRLRSGRLELQPAPLPLRDWLEGLRRSWSVSTESKGNRFRLQIEGELPQGILIDGHRLRQVLDNLLSNANRHTHAGEVRLTLLVSLVKRRQQAKLEFLVSDTGEGIPPELLPLIFEPFVRGEQQGGQGGFGLGLPIARELLRRMDSDITVNSHLGEGSLFRFVLTCPVCPEAEPAPTGAAPCPPVLAEASLSPGTARILVVDDQAEDRLLLLDQLTRLGIQGVAAASGHEAMALLAETEGLMAQGWHGVITDQRMAHGDGWAVLRFVRDRLPSLPVILVSAEPPRRPDSLPEQYNFDAFLTKPFDLPELSLALHGLCFSSRKEASPVAQDQLEALLELIEGGEVTAIEAWCEQTRAADETMREFAEKITTACRQLDFPEMDRLARERLEPHHH